MRAMTASAVQAVQEKRDRAGNVEQLLSFARDNDAALDAMTDGEFDAIATEAMRQCEIDSENGMRELFQRLKPRVEVRILC